MRSNKGFSLVELLISLLLGSVLLTIVISLYVTGVSTGSKSLNYSRLRTDLQSLITLIEKDIRRAGYGGDEYLVGISANKSIDINSAQDCIVYYYNHNETPTLEHSNKMAFSFKNRAIKFKTGVGQVADSVCAVSNGWTRISDDKFITIKELMFTENMTSSASATLRNISIKLTGELASDSQYSHSISSALQVRNLELNH
jgi:prepilin-type N-terminal cleavage/methylation domain-containing protein